MMTDRTLWTALPVAAVLIDLDDRILACNPAAETFLNLSAKAVIGQLIWDRIDPGASVREAYARAKSDQSQLRVNDIEINRKDRAPALCTLHCAPYPQGAPDASGAVLMLLSLHEMAGLSRGQVMTGRAAKSAVGMAEMLAHEIKNPLAGITGAAQLLAMNLSAQDREMTDLIVDECRRIVKLLQQVEQFGNLIPPVCAPVNIHDVLERAKQSAALSFAAHMRFVKEYDPSLPPALADADQLIQVFLNLIKNAAEACKGSGILRLRSFYDPALRVVSENGSRAALPLQIEITDDGPGIPPELMADIFDPFVSGRENGTGLGLALVSKIITQTGGRIGVESAPGRTAFRVSLPVAGA